MEEGRPPRAGLARRAPLESIPAPNLVSARKEAIRGFFRDFEGPQARVRLPSFDEADFIEVVPEWNYRSTVCKGVDLEPRAALRRRSPRPVRDAERLPGGQLGLFIYFVTYF